MMTTKEIRLERGLDMIGILIAVLLAALVYALCVALGLPAIVAIIAAILVLLAGIPSGGYGLGNRFGGGRGVGRVPPVMGRPSLTAAKPDPRSRPPTSS